MHQVVPGIASGGEGKGHAGGGKPRKPRLTTLAGACLLAWCAVSAAQGANDENLASVATSRNQFAVSSALQLASQGDLSPAGAQLIGAVQSLNAEQARSAFDALSGSGLTGAQNLTLLSTQAFVTSLQDPLRAARESGGAPEAAPQLWAALLQSGAHLPGDAGVGSALEHDRLWGLALGVEQSPNPELSVGAALGLTQGEFSVAPQQTGGTVRGWQAGIYGQWQLDSAYINTRLAYGSFDNRVRRSVDPFGGLGEETPMESDYDSEAWRARAELGRTMPWRGVGHVALYAAVEWAEVRNQGYSETGSETLGLNVAKHTTGSVPGYLGLRMDNRHEWANGMVLTPSMDVAWAHEFWDCRCMRASFQALPGTSFRVDGTRPPRDTLAVKVGAQLVLSTSAVIHARVGAELADHAYYYSAQAGVQLRW